MSRNTLSDLNNHLFAQLERLGDESLDAEKLAHEVERSKAINGVAKNIVENARVSLEGANFIYKSIPDTQTDRIPDQFRLKK